MLLFQKDLESKGCLGEGSRIFFGLFTKEFSLVLEDY